MRWLQQLRQFDYFYAYKKNKISGCLFYGIKNEAHCSFAIQDNERDSNDLLGISYHSLFKNILSTILNLKIFITITILFVFAKQVKRT